MFVSLLSLIAFRANFIVLHGVVALKTKQDELSYPVFFETLITIAVHLDSKPMKIQSKCNKKQTVFELYLGIAVRSRLNAANRNSYVRVSSKIKATLPLFRKASNTV